MRNRKSNRNEQFKVQVKPTKTTTTHYSETQHIRFIPKKLKRKRFFDRWMCFIILTVLNCKQSSSFIHLHLLYYNKNNTHTLFTTTLLNQTETDYFHDLYTATTDNSREG